MNLSAGMRGKDMDSRTAKICIVVAIAAVASAGIGIFCLTSENDNHKDTFEITITGIDSFGNYALDLNDKTFEEHGMKIGEVFELNIEGKKCKGQMTTLYSGTPLFGLFINQDNGVYNMGMFCYDITAVFDCPAGTTFTLTHEGKISENIEKIPAYMGGYSDNPEDYADLVYFANFREVDVGDVKDDTFYRSASPYPTYGTQRHVYVNQYLEKEGVECLLIMNVDLDKVKDQWPTDCYSYKLLQEGKVIAKKYSPSIFNYPDQVAEFMETIADSEGKLGISCALGKDRTGFYIAMLEALAGGSYKEIREDFMETLCNFYAIEPFGEEYETLATMLIDPVFYIFENPNVARDPTVVDWSEIHVDVDSVDAYKVVYDYLTQFVGVSEETMQDVIDRLSE